VTEYLSDFLDKALLNNTYNYEDLHKTLNTSLMNSFSYLYEAQRALIDYNEFHYRSDDEESRLVDRIGHLYLNNNSRAFFEMDYDLIDSDSRETYRNSMFYDQQITIEDISYNPKIFKKIPIVQIDNQTIWDYTIHCNEDGTTFTLPNSFGRTYVYENERNTYYELCEEGTENSYLVVDNDYLVEHGLIYNNKTMRMVDVVNRKIKEGTAEPGNFVLYFDLPIFKEHKISVMVIDSDTYYRVQYSYPSSRTNGIGYVSNNGTVDIPINTLWFDYSNYSYYVIESTTLIQKDISSREIQSVTYSSLEEAEAAVRSLNLLEGVYFSYEYTVNNIYAYYTRKWCEKYNVKTYSALTPAQQQEMRKVAFATLVDIRISSKGILMCSIHTNLEGSSNPLGSELIPLTENGRYYSARLTTRANQIASSSNILYVSYIFFRNLCEYKDYTGNNQLSTSVDKEGNYKVRLATLANGNNQLYRNPVPVENMILFKKGILDEGFNLVSNTSFINLHYPFTYEIKDDSTSASDVYRLFYFYDNFNSNNVSYRNIFGFWYKFLTENFEYDFNNSLDAIMNAYQYGILNYPDNWGDDFIEAFESSYDKIFNYEYKKWHFGDKDYLNKYLPNADEDKKSPIIYKDLKMREFETYDEEVLRRYVLTENKLGKSFYMYTNTMDLSTRIRRDTSQEFDTTIIQFNEDRYVFAMNNDTDYPYLSNARVFVDGLLISDVVQLRKNFLDYFYIPCDMCTEDSFIEIEVFPDYEYNINLTFDTMDDKFEIDAVNNYQLLPVVDMYLSEDKTYATDKDGNVIAAIAGIVYYDVGHEYKYAVDGLYSWKPSKISKNIGKFIPYNGNVRYVVADDILGDDYNPEKMVHNAAIDYDRLRILWEGGMFTYPFLTLVANALIGSIRGPFEFIDKDGNVTTGEFATNANIKQEGSLVDSFVLFERIRPDDAFPNFMDLTLATSSGDVPPEPGPDPQPYYPINEYEEGSGHVYSGMTYFSRSDFKFTKITEYKDIDFRETFGPEAVKHVPLERFYIQPNTPDVLGSPIEIGFHKNSYRMEIIVDEEGYPYIEIPFQDWNHHRDYVRVYHNGRFLPKSMYQVFTTFDYPRIIILDWCEIDDLLFVDITPYRYQEVPLTEEMTTLDENNLIIDLSTVITKPFDIRYYDIYLNGRKLSRNNVIKLNAWQITLVNIKSIYNLRIYERDRDWEFYGLDYSSPIYTYTFDDFIHEIFIDDENKKKIIKDIIDEQKDKELNIVPNTNDEEKMDYDSMDDRYIIPYIFYYSELLPKSYLYPDYLQENEEIMRTNFNIILDNFSVLPAREKQPDVLMLDPDIVLEGEGDKVVVYTVGHIEDDVDQEILDEEVIMPE
jgi:hypothetical protein